jgi:hypothetical protein
MSDLEAEFDRQLLHLERQLLHFDLCGSISIPKGHNCYALSDIGWGE